MIPYCEPYQSTYQQRRLANLGMEWHPPTMALSVGTGDDVTYFPQDQPTAFQPPIALSPERDNGPGPANVDRNRWVEQPPEVVEPMDWEQDAVVHSEDTGSDYSASEESVSDEKEGDDGYESLSEGESNSEEEEEEASIQLRRSGRNKRKKMVSTSSALNLKQKRCSYRSIEPSSAYMSRRSDAICNFSHIHHSSYSSSLMVQVVAGIWTYWTASEGKNFC